MKDYASITAHHERVLSPIPIEAEQNPDSGIRDRASAAYMLYAWSMVKGHIKVRWLIPP